MTELKLTPIVRRCEYCESQITNVDADCPCQLVSYCSKGCQKADHVFHKVACKLVRAKNWIFKLPGMSFYKDMPKSKLKRRHPDFFLGFRHQDYTLNIFKSVIQENGFNLQDGADGYEQICIYLAKRASIQFDIDWFYKHAQAYKRQLLKGASRGLVRVIEDRKRRELRDNRQIHCECCERLIALRKAPLLLLPGVHAIPQLKLDGKTTCACNIVSYCSPTCQEADYPFHKPVCAFMREHKFFRKEMRSMPEYVETMKVANLSPAKTHEILEDTLRKHIAKLDVSEEITAILSIYVGSYAAQFLGNNWSFYNIPRVKKRQLATFAKRCEFCMKMLSEDNTGTLCPCKLVSYCNEDCQKADRAYHKAACKYVMEEKLTFKLTDLSDYDEKYRNQSVLFHETLPLPGEPERKDMHDPWSRVITPFDKLVREKIGDFQPTDDKRYHIFNPICCYLAAKASHRYNLPWMYQCARYCKEEQLDGLGMKL